MSSIAGLIGAMVVGQIYGSKFKEMMPKRLRLNVTIIYTATQIVLGLLYFLILGFPDLLLMFGLLIGLSLIYSLFIYWALGSGQKVYLKAVQKREEAKK